MRLTSAMSSLAWNFEQRTAPGWLPGHRGHQQQPRGQRQLRVIRRDAQPRVEPVIESPCQLAEVSLQAPPGRGLARISDLDVHRQPPSPCHNTALSARALSVVEPPGVEDLHQAEIGSFASQPLASWPPPSPTGRFRPARSDFTGIPELGVIDIAGYNMAASRKIRNVAADGQGGLRRRRCCLG